MHDWCVSGSAMDSLSIDEFRRMPGVERNEAFVCEHTLQWHCTVCSMLKSTKMTHRHTLILWLLVCHKNNMHQAPHTQNPTNR